ncbi:uncharacterized protein LOC117707747 isoform X1 [Arvicanthis niloticus]|uniref:uncharacterized protein LOC117707747 isoform X1 n=1 Tax=Arvicanthis niloticus TaxID=61156 RepID=UPI00402B82DB
MPDPAKSAPAPKKGSKKAVTKVQKKDGKKRKRSRKESYSVYVYKVLKQVHPDTGISSKAMGIMNSFVNDIFERIAAPTVLKPAGRPCMLDTEKAKIAVSAGSLASTRHSLKLGWTLNFSPAAAAAAAAAAASPKGGHQGSLLECADPTGTPSWVILQLRIGEDCQPLVMLRSRRCEVSQHYRALSPLSNGALPIPEGIEHAPPFSTCFLLLQTQSRSFHSCQLGESN